MFKIKLTSFLTGVCLAVCLLAVLFASPEATYAKPSKKVVETKLTTTPSDPDGQDSWFTSVTVVELDLKAHGETYFQWNQTNGDWIKYKTPFRAYRGENTLYYYSVAKSGVKEAVQSKVIKVDYIKPTLVKAKIESVDGAAKIDIESQADVVKYKIYKRDGKSYKTIDTVSTNSYVDQDVKIGETSVYKVVAIDRAGLKSDKAQLVVKIVKPVAKSVVVSTPAVVEKVEVKIQPQIAQGASTTSVKQPSSVNDLKIAETVTPAPTSQPVVSAKNWNRLYIAIAILLVAAAAAVGGYYAYEWWTNRAEPKDKPKEKKSNSRW